MATFTAARAQAGVSARANEKNVFVESSTYTFLGTETAASIINMCKVAPGSTILALHLIGTTNTASLTLAVADVTLGTAWIPATSATTAAKTDTKLPPVTYAAADTIKVTTAAATATAGATVTVIVWMTQDKVVTA